MEDKKYYKELTIYYIKSISFNLIMIFLLSLIAYKIGDWTFLIVGGLVLNLLRVNSESCIHCDKLYKCIILTNLLFMSCGLIVSYGIHPILAYMGVFISGVLLYREDNSKSVRGVLLASMGISIVSPTKVVSSIFLSILLVLLLNRKEVYLDDGE